MRVLIVGAGLAGAVYARTLAEHGIHVTVIDGRDHIGGNCYDFTTRSGVRIHKYGPHLFHTSNLRVVDWLSRFTAWLPYEHRVVARLPNGQDLPLPVNIDTVNGVFGVRLSNSADLSHFLSEQAEAIDPVVSAEDYLISTIGRRLTDLFFRPYTRKMWDLDLSAIDKDVVRRVQVRSGQDDRYFPTDKFQAMPRDGYTCMFSRIFNQERIEIFLNRRFKHEDLQGFDYCFNSMPIDEFFNYQFGELPYRSIRFHTDEISLEEASQHVTINFTDTGPFTRETWWHNIPGHHLSKTGMVPCTREEPCGYAENNFERYYPIKTSDGVNENIYEKYRLLSLNNDRVKFIGRCGTYQYLDMHQVIQQSLMGVSKWFKEMGISEELEP